MPSTLAGDVRADLGDDWNRPWGGRIGLLVLRALFTQRFQAVLLFRLSQAAGARWGLLGTIVKWVNGVLTGCDIAWQATIGSGVVFFHPSGVVIGPDATLGGRCRIMQHVTIGTTGGLSPVVGDDVFIGPGAVIVGGITVGSRSRIGANSVVLESVPEGATVSGIPARVHDGIGGRET